MIESTLHFAAFLVLTTVALCGCQRETPTRGGKEEAVLRAKIEHLIETIDDNTDPLHSEISPSVDQLIEIGEPVLPYMLNLASVDDVHKRLQATFVIEHVLMDMLGGGPTGWKSHDEMKRFDEFVRSHGIDPFASADERNAQIGKLRAWLEARSSQ